MFLLLLGFLGLAGVFPGALGFSITRQSVSKLLDQHASAISTLKEEASKLVDTSIEPYSNDVFFLRYCLDTDESVGSLTDTLVDNIKWRQGSGKGICEAAQAAFAKATAGGKWNNEPVQESAPHASLINPYLTSSQCLTTSTSSGDLIYCIRAGKIDDVSLMNSLSSPQDMVDFFLYCKEINALAANQRSLATDKLVYVLTANDLSGVRLIGGDASFRTALSDASKAANPLYPNLAGPTLLLNLPKLLGALVKLFTPLFPPEVRARIKFEQGPLQDVDDLVEISPGGSKREKFLKEIDESVYSAT